MAKHKRRVREEEEPLTTGPWMRTYTGARVHILQPDPGEIRLKDIAHALANQCRFAGHTPEFYSVAQHSVLVAGILEDMGWPDLAISGLMHDAAEAYLHDLHRPLKECLPQYADLEQRHMAAICVKFGLPVKLHTVVKRADNIALATEFRDLWAEPLEGCARRAGEMPSARRIKPICPESAERAFMRRFRALEKKRAAA